MQSKLLFWSLATLTFLAIGQTGFTTASTPEPHKGPFPGSPCTDNSSCEYETYKSFTHMICNLDESEGQGGHCICATPISKSIYHFNYFTGICEPEKGDDSESRCIFDCGERATCEEPPGGVWDGDSFDGVCRCNADFSIHRKHSVCVRKYGDRCNRLSTGLLPQELGDSECWVQDEYFTCGRLEETEPYRCGCYEPYVYDNATEVCVRPFGYECPIVKPSWEPGCQGGFYSECAGEGEFGKCACQANFTFDPTSKTCVKTKGQSCNVKAADEPEECDLRSFLECGRSNSVAVTECQCKAGYEPDNKAGGVCRARSGAECESSQDCKKDFFCSAEGKCVCPIVLVDGMCGCPEGQEIWEYPGQPSKCRVKPTDAAPCQDDSVCGPNSHCSSGRCRCFPGATDIDGFCYFSVGDTVPDSVDSTTACAPTFTYENGKCICNGVHDKVIQKCVPANSEVNNCADNGDCEGFVAHCVTTASGVKQCQCKEGYVEKGGNCTGGTYARACGTDSQCDETDGFGCTNDICQCKNEHFVLANGRCVVRAGGKCDRELDTCEADFTCTSEDGSSSSSGVCLCSGGKNKNALCARGGDDDEPSKIVIGYGGLTTDTAFALLAVIVTLVGVTVLAVVMIRKYFENSQREMAIGIVENLKFMMVDSKYQGQTSDFLSLDVKA